MSRKLYQITGKEEIAIAEPAAAYGPAAPEISASDDWNPNVPFHGTQEEWRKHFRRIEEGEFMSIEEADEKFETWKKKLLASRM